MTTGGQGPIEWEMAGVGLGMARGRDGHGMEGENNETTWLLNQSTEILICCLVFIYCFSL